MTYDCLNLTTKAAASGDVDKSHFSSKATDNSTKLWRHRGHLPRTTSNKEQHNSIITFISHNFSAVNAKLNQHLGYTELSHWGTRMPNANSL